MDFQVIYQMLPYDTYLQGRFRIVRPLGKGGMGQVYEAMDEALECKVAIKQTFARTEELRKAFRREAKLLANLRHHNLPRVTNHFFEGDGQFIVMDFVEGDNLERRLERRGIPFGVTEVRPLADQLLDALEYLHGLPSCILHRDIKPANIKLSENGSVYLLDFGLAKGSFDTVGGAGTGNLSVYGYTAHYAPLEQITAAGTTPQSDLYALGATLYHLLTGQMPVAAGERYSQIEQDFRDPIIPAASINPHISDGVTQFLERAMQMSRRDRFQSAREMRQALDSICDSDSVARITTPGFQVIETANLDELFIPKPGSTSVDTVHSAPIPKPRSELPSPAASSFSDATTYISRLFPNGLGKTLIAPIRVQFALLQDRVRVSPVIRFVSIVLALAITTGLLGFVYFSTRESRTNYDPNKEFQRKADLQQKTSDAGQAFTNATNLLNQGKKKEGEREFSRAEGLFNQAIEIDSQNAKLRVSLASVYVAQKKWAAAASAYEIALSLDPENKEYQSSLVKIKNNLK